MGHLVLDIETIGDDFDKLDKITQESLTRWIKKESQGEEEYRIALQELKDGLGFSPLTGQIVAIGVLDVEKDKGAVYYQNPDNPTESAEEDGIKLQAMPEKEMLEKFWEGVKHYDALISFNGRAFDVPFLMVRSAIHEVRPSKDLMSNRYLGLQKYSAKHIDLLDQLTFYGSVRKKGSLHLWCGAFGIKSPKEDGITGEDVTKLFKEKKFLDIARYNIGDIRATKELFEYWNEYLRF